MEGLLGFAQEFLRDAKALARALEIDRARDSRLGALEEALAAFVREELPLDGLVMELGRALRETLVVGGSPVPLWGFAHEDERAFPERLALAASRTPEVNLSGVLRLLLGDAESLADEERTNRLLAFADFVADLDGRGAEGDPRLGVGPSANFLTFAWHALTQAREPVFLYGSNKAIKAAAEASGEPLLRANDLEGRFRVFYLVSRRLAGALREAPSAMRPGWAVEHALEWMLERMSTVAAATKGASVDAGLSGVWNPRSRAEVRKSPPSGRHGAASPLARAGVTIQPSRVDEKQERRATEKLNLGEDGNEDGEKTRPLSVERRALPATEKLILDRTDRPEGKPADRAIGISKAKTRIEPSTPPGEKHEPEPKKEQERPATRPLPRLVARGTGTGTGAAAGTAAAPHPSPPPASRGDGTGVAGTGARVAKPKIQPPAKAAAPPSPGHTSEEVQGRLVSQALGELIGEIAIAEAEPAEADAAHEDAAKSDRLARDLGVDEVLVADLLDALARRGRVLLVGPPAAGKTYLARRLALHVAGREERTVFLRLHPALGYDELVEARLPDGTIAPGIVRELADRARREREGRFALVLDEVDRGDLARALGELSGALAERGAEVRLGRSRERFSFPRNLAVIATARTFPQELVGRFPVIEVAPDAEAVRRFFARSRPQLEWTADLLRALNAKLEEARGPQARVGHGLLMDAELDLPRLEGIWRREVLPLVRSFGLDPRKFEISALKKP